MLRVLLAGTWIPDAPWLGMGALGLCLLVVLVARRRQFAAALSLRRARRAATQGHNDEILRIDQLSELAEQLAHAAEQLDARLTRRGSELEAQSAAQARTLATLTDRAAAQIAALQRLLARAESLASLPAPRPRRAPLAPDAASPLSATLAPPASPAPRQIENPAPTADNPPRRCDELRTRVLAALAKGTSAPVAAAHCGVPLGEVELIQRLHEYACPKSPANPRSPTAPPSHRTDDTPERRRRRKDPAPSRD